MVDRNQGAICLGPTGNLQESYAFLFLCTGRKITRSQFTQLPTQPRVPWRVIAMAIHEKKQNGLVFEDRNGVEVPMIYEDSPSNGAGAAGKI